MTEPLWWYVLHVKANKESRVVEDIQKAFDNESISTDYELEAFCPESEQYYRNKNFQISGQKYKKRPLFPGYVFIETNMPAEIFLCSFSYYIYSSENIIRILRNGAGNSIAMPESERIKFGYLFMGERCLKHSEGYIEGDKIVITGGPLIGREAEIKHINRHNREAILELDCFGVTISAKVALEVISKK